jgi:hypothetical protein
MFAVILTLVLVASADAKRKAPNPVTPVVANGVRYSAVMNGRDESVSAVDAVSGRELWRATVFHNQYDPSLENDVQDVFITDLALQGVTLLVKDEKSRMFSIDLKTRTVKELKY